MEQQQLKLESNITQALMIGLIGSNSIYLVRDILVSDYSVLTWGSVLLVLFSATSIYLIRVHQLFEKIYFPALLIIHAIHVGIFFYINGFNSTLALDFINIGFVIVFAGSGWQRRVLASIFIVSLSGLMLYQAFGPVITDYYNDNIVLDTVLHIGVSLYLAYAIKKAYTRFQMTIEKTNKELSTSNAELQSANEEISLLNEQLEEEVQRKSSEAHDRRLRLIHYASKNAHEVRAPLVRIMGLVEILRMETPKDPAELRYLIRLIDNNAKEMNSILSEVSRVFR
ncbi:histidine kinase dimerization/phospho-acceptor domain-containing protein [Rhodoflexus sp.]